ncbi:MAG: xanthine dehydrogenase family protein subunit M [Bacteroidia bacterium]|nr:MAG: xanthine dehydrogenase family protein subunit M [Bacteroidia bacterium]
MPISQNFSYTKATSLNEALALLHTHDKEAAVLAGGTDLANMLKQGFPVPEMMIDIKGVEELKQITLEGNTLQIGCLVTFSDILSSEVIKKHCHALWEAANLVASAGVRNRATMAGNICTAVACMDSAGPLLVHDAVIHVNSMSGTRQIPANKWFVDNRKTAIKSNEMLTYITMELPQQPYGSAYQKLMRYSGEDLAQANVGVLALQDGSFKIAFGAVGPTPKRCRKIEHFLKGKELTEEVLSQAKEMVPSVISPITDIRATKEYRTHMTMHMMEEALKLARERIK